MGQASLEGLAFTPLQQLLFLLDEELLVRCCLLSTMAFTRCWPVGPNSSPCKWAAGKTSVSSQDETMPYRRDGPSGSPLLWPSSKDPYFIISASSLHSGGVGNGHVATRNPPT